MEEAWQNEELAGRKRRKAERYAGHRVTQMEKKSKEPKVSGEHWPLGFKPRQETRNEEQQSLASGAKAATHCRQDSLQGDEQ